MSGSEGRATSYRLCFLGRHDWGPVWRKNGIWVAVRTCRRCGREALVNL